MLLCLAESGSLGVQAVGHLTTCCLNCLNVGIELSHDVAYELIV